MVFRNPGTAPGDTWVDPNRGRTPAPGSGPGSQAPDPGGFLPQASNPVEFDFGSYSSPSYSGPMSPNINLGNAPIFSYEQFQAPDFQAATSDPGYQLRLQEGEQALQRSAAARGLLRSGGTLKDLVQYGQNFAANEYQNVFNRELQRYGANYQGALDANNSRMAEWMRNADLKENMGMAAFQRQFDAYNSAAAGSRFNEQMLGNILGQIGTPQAPSFPSF